MNDMLFSERLLEVMSDEELDSICAHEATHLTESKWVFIGRLFGTLALYPLIFILPVIHRFGLPGLLMLFVPILALVFLSRWLARRMEKRADASAAQQAADPVMYARALEKIYETNCMPATMPKRSRLPHPDLYDRMVTAGVTPSYERPQPPSKMSWTTFLLTGLLGLQLGIMISRSQGAYDQDAAHKGSSPPSLSQQPPRWTLLNSEVSTNNDNTNIPGR
jgi:hypothetical protein